MLLAALVLFATAACGVQSNTGSGSSETGGTPLAQAVAPEQETINFGGQYRFDDGLTVAVSKPTSFQPSASAYPRSDRAANAASQGTARIPTPWRRGGMSASGRIR